MSEQPRTADLIRLYEDRFREVGGDITTLGWKNREEQRLRFKMLCDIGELNGTSICDVGCGFGDLIDYLCDNRKETRYTGLDIAPSLLDHARKLHPGIPFVELNLAEQRYEEQHDYFLSSGALSFKMQDNMAFAEDMLGKMFALARKGVAVNFLSTYVNYQHERNFHYSPEEMFRMARKFTKWVKLRHDYPLWEFTLYMYKEAQP